MPISYLPKVNQRTLGSELLIVNEAHIIGITGVATISTNYVRLIEVPLQEVPSTVIIPGFTEVTTAPGTNEFKVDYANGRIIFNAVQNGNTVYVTYKGRGSIVDGEDINEIQQVFVGSVTPGSPTIGIANLNGTLSAGIVRPNNISTVLTDNFTFPNDIIVTGDATINGDLDVKGALTYIESTTVRIDDPIIQLNYNQVAQNSGIEVERGVNPAAQLIWNESTLAWSLNDTTGTPILQAFNTGNVSITGSLLSLKNSGSTILGLTTAADPISIPAATVDNNSGIVITTTLPVLVTLPSPTVTTAGRFFTVLHNDTSTGTLNLNSSNIGVGKGSTYMWDGTAWVPVGATGGFQVMVGDPGAPVVGDTWFDTTVNQFKGYNGTNAVILG